MKTQKTKIITLDDPGIEHSQEGCCDNTLLVLNFPMTILEGMSIFLNSKWGSPLETDVKLFLFKSL